LFRIQTLRAFLQDRVKFSFQRTKSDEPIPEKIIMVDDERRDKIA
jgi:hypothetical protein